MHKNAWPAIEPPTTYEPGFPERAETGIAPDPQIHSALFLRNHCVRLRRHHAAAHEYYSCDTEHDRLWECRRRPDSDGQYYFAESRSLGSQDRRHRRERSGLFDRGRSHFSNDSSGRCQCDSKIAIHSNGIRKHDRASDDYKQPRAQSHVNRERQRNGHAGT